MKKTLLFTTLSIAFLGNSQTLTQTNEAAVGASQTMYVCDSFVDRQENVNGNTATWDFTALEAYGSETRAYEIGDASLSSFATDFPTSAKTLKIGAIETFYNSTATERMSQGFVFNEPTIGDITAVFSDEAKLTDYPMGYGDNFTDLFDGTLNVPNFGPSALSGEIKVSIDGQGTLNLPNGVTYTNVIRVKSADSTHSTVTLAPLPPTDVYIKRTQYEYFDINNSSLPKLVITHIELISSLFNDEQTLVLASDDPMQYLGLDKNNTVNFTIAPNPSTDKITLSGDFSNDAVGTIIDQNGKVMLTSPIKNGTTLDISTFANGTYFLNISSNGNSTSKTIVKK